MPPEHRVLSYLLFCFLAAALLLVGYTWWRKADACHVQCVTSGYSTGSISFSGGGRFSMGTICTCMPVTSSG